MSIAIRVPAVLHALSVKVRSGKLIIQLRPAATVCIEIESLGEPWTSASKKAVENVRLEIGGSWLFWGDLDEGIALDEWLPYALGIEPAALLGKRNRGKKASPAKARAARRNGKKGGRPRKVA